MEKTKQDTAQRAEVEALQAAQTEDGGGDSENTGPEDLVLRFSNPYKFGGMEYNDVDLSGLENVTAGVLENVGKIVSKKNPSLNPALQEMSLVFCPHLAQRVSRLPLEFFAGLPAKEAIKLKSLITTFLYGGGGEG